MSQKKNNGRRFAIDLGDDEDDIDFGFGDDFDHVQNICWGICSIDVVLNASNLHNDDSIDFGSDEDFAPKKWALFSAR